MKASSTSASERLASARGRKAWLPQFWWARKKNTCTQNWPRLVSDGEDVGLLHRLGDDIALRLDQGERAQAVAEQGGALEIEVLGGLVHVRDQVILH